MHSLQLSVFFYKITTPAVFRQGINCYPGKSCPLHRPPAAKKQRQEQPQRPAPVRMAADPPSDDQAFEDRLKKFMQESDSRIADNRMYSDRPRRRGRR